MNHETGSAVENEALRKRGPCFSARLPKHLEWRQPHHPCRTSGIQGYTWTFSRALWISPFARASPAILRQSPPELEIKPAHGTGGLTRRARAFQIPNGAVGSQSIESESFLRDSSAELGAAAFHSVRARPPRRSRLSCGTQ